MAQDSECLLCITPGACLFGASMLFIIPLPWVFSWIVAAMWHEVFHCIALILCRKNIREVIISAGGAEIRTGALTDMEAFICALAGPVGGCSLFLLSSAFPRLAICGFLQSLFNLIPIYPLDGGQAVRGLAGLILTERGASILCMSFEIITIMMIMLCGIWLTFTIKLGFVPVLLAIILIAHIKKIKIPCK